MGVPKFFRYISERYPCLSELVKEYQIPVFDNLYLDMNGIIHMCSHPDDNDPHFRITEEKIFADIFHYIEVLFRMIKPQKVFFMAIDGVAPRAKMNQQRGRRFRSAKDAEKMELKAKEKGEELPTEARFDSNCITPGTIFMAKLQDQLKYYVVNKITTDKLWRDCKIILSGHETPGEGEHKIMDYIRFMRAQPGYDPNTRHCLYGLDADLMMLGLCTHEPHFSLLREEVRFGKKSTKRKSSPEEITFFLLHLSLMREYLELEFSDVKDTLPFEYNFENIIDDWVLMGFLVGNDFIPHLPNLHIANGALPLLYSAYMKVLPSLNGYINEGGHLHLDRFEKFMEALQCFDMDHFSEQYADLKYFEGKTGRRPNDKERTSYKPKTMEEWKPEDADDSATFGSLQPEWNKPMDSGLAALIKATEDICLAPSKKNLDALAAMSGDDEDDIDLEEGDSNQGSIGDETEDDLIDAEFKLHKQDYYMNKLHYEQVTPEVMRAQAEGYVRAIQWNLHYYYNSVCSWSWFYPHHYAPFISDIKNFKDFKFDFKLGKPFHPYEQLLAVLPAASKELLPEVYHGLMTDEKSIIKDYYPEDFETDLNGKRQEWEAVVCIPFIDEKLLLEAMAPANAQLTPAEIKRNSHGPMLKYTHTENDLGDYDAPEYFPRIKNSHAECQPIFIEDIRVPIEKLVKGPYPGVVMDVYYPGFPTMKHLKYGCALDKAKVKVFEQPSRGENMILIIKHEELAPITEVAQELLGKSVFVGWPHLVEALVVTVSDYNRRYHSKGSDGEYNIEESRGNIQQNWDLEKRGITEFYLERLGVDVGETKIMVHVRVMIGRKYEFTPHGRVNLEKQWATNTSAYPIQTIVKNIKVFNEQYATYKDISDVFVENSTCFMLGQPHYGSLGTVMDSKATLTKGRVKVSLNICDEPDLDRIRAIEHEIRVKYMNLYTACSRLGISKNLLSRITGTILVVMGVKNDVVSDDCSKMNIGLNLKFTKKNEEIPGYTKKDKMWLYSQKALDLVADYMDEQPKLFEYLNRSSSNDIYFEYEVFPEDAGSGKTVKEIIDWLKKQPFYSVERQQCGSSTLEPDVVKELEKVIDIYDNQCKRKSLVMQVKPHLLHKPEIQMGNLAPDTTTTYQLYDRVINVRESYTVPIGYTGTVIAIHKSQPTAKPEDIMYDILFDKPFAGGLALNCSSNRGYRMSRVALINKSHGTRVMEQKTGKPGQLLQQLSEQPQPQGSISTQWHQHQQHNNYQSQNQQQQPNYPSYHSSNSAFASWNQSQQPNNQYNKQSPNNYSASPPTQHNQGGYNNKQYSNNAKSNNYYQQPRQYANQSPQQQQQQYHKQTKVHQQSIDDKNNFMPTFNDGKSASSKSESDGNVSSDTEMLKKMLNINNDQPKQIKQRPKHAPNDVTNLDPSAGGIGVQLSVQDMFAHASVLQNRPMQNTTLPSSVQTSYSLKLLSHYQLKGLGCPHYKYFNGPDGNQQYAQLIIPYSNELVFGGMADSKELACEYVAKEVLNRLATKENVPAATTIGLPAPMQFPIPPAQWRQNDQSSSQRSTHQQQHHVKSSNRSRHHDHDRNLNMANSPPKSGDLLNSPFVPLQAVRQSRGGNKSDKNEKREIVIKCDDKPDESMKTDKIRQGPVSQQGNATKPRRERKMRIAANFSGV